MAIGGSGDHVVPTSNSGANGSTGPSSGEGSKSESAAAQSVHGADDFAAPRGPSNVDAPPRTTISLREQALNDAR
jgi:hypothetical protein